MLDLFPFLAACNGLSSSVIFSSALKTSYLLLGILYFKSFVLIKFTSPKILKNN